LQSLQIGQAPRQNVLSALSIKSKRRLNSASYAAQTHVYVESLDIDLVTVTTIRFFVLFFVLFPRFLDVRLVAISKSIFVVVAGVLDIFAVRAGNRAAVTSWLLVHGIDGLYAEFTHASFAGSTAGGWS